MQNCTFELLVNILTYAIKNKNESFSQKDFKNVVYTEEFNNFDINEKIAQGFEFLLKRGVIKLEKTNFTYYEKYKLPKTLRVKVEDNIASYKNVSKKILLFHEGIENFDENGQIKDKYSLIIDFVKMLNTNLLKTEDRLFLKDTLCKILISLKQNNHYSLFIILQLLKLKTCVDIEVKNDETYFYAKNVKFDFIEFYDDSLVLHFDKCHFQISSLKDIAQIVSISETSLKELIPKSINILEKYEDKNLLDFKNYLQSFL